MALIIELALAILALAVSLAGMEFTNSSFERVESTFRRIANQRSLAVVFVAGFAIAIRLIVLPLLPEPVPRIGDEYSHLLLADTLLHGRLANPTHPMWVHFETTEVNMRPTYASIYPPTQGVFLAFGRLMTGNAFAGVLLSVGVLCGAICWMLQGFLPPQWALVGGLLAVMRFAVFGYWADSYMGGAPAAIGGALLLGTILRIRQNPSPLNGVILGLGAAILANSRPYEGLLLCAVAFFALLHVIWTSRREERRKIFRCVLLPTSAVALLFASGMMYYFWRTTGSAFLNPYQLVWETYGMVPKFPWQTLRPQQMAALRHEALKHIYYVFEMRDYLEMRSASGALTAWGVRAILAWKFYLGPLLSLPLALALVSAPYGFRLKQLSAETKILLACAVVTIAGTWVEVIFYAHYLAPAASVFIALVVIAMRHLGQRRDIRAGLWLSRLVPALCLLMVAIRVAVSLCGISRPASLLPSFYDSAIRKTAANSASDYLEKLPGRHLVIVHYVPGTEGWMGWVHNDADIDESRIVRAWDMGVEKNRELVNYFSGRQVWFAIAGEDDRALIPYSEAARDMSAEAKE